MQQCGIKTKKTKKLLITELKYLHNGERFREFYTQPDIGKERQAEETNK